MKVLMVSKAFMKNHRRAGQPTAFPVQVAIGRKIHTLRENEKGYFKDGDMVSVRHWTGAPYRSKQKEIVQVRIGIEPVVLSYSSRFYFVAAIGQKLIQPRFIAANDGLELGDFLSWFFPDGKFGEFRGDIIHFTDFRYAKGAR